MPFCVLAHGVTQKRPNFFSPINDTLCFPTEKEADKEVLIHARRFDTDPAYFFHIWFHLRHEISKEQNFMCIFNKNLLAKISVNFKKSL